jgi:hypothetical protein
MGGLLCEGSIETVQNDPRVVEVYLGHGQGQKAREAIATQELQQLQLAQLKTA